MAFDKQLLADRYAIVKAGLPKSVTLIAVSKKRTVEEIQALYDLGHRAFGENYPQELRDKQPLLPKDIEWHFIGHLQSNKVKYIAPFVHLIHTIDGEGLLDEVQKRAAKTERKINVLIQVHIAKEETKHGAALEDVPALLQAFNEDRWPNVRLKGLMGMATNSEDNDLVHQEFQGLNTLFNDLRSKAFCDPVQFTELSMGMSSDATIAIKNGSTMVRIGTAIFGDR